MNLFNMFKEKKEIKKEIKNNTKFVTKKTKKYELDKFEFEKWQKNSKEIKYENTMQNNCSIEKSFFDLLVRYVPNISGAIWTWNKLCNTPFEVNLTGGTDDEKNEAQLILKNLEKKLNPIKSVKNGGFNNLLNVYFNHLFTYGKFSGELIIENNLKGIENFLITNPFSIVFTNKLEMAININNNLYLLNENTSYFIAQNMDPIDNPYGKSMLEAVPSLVKIANDLLRDMANSSSNAAIPRMHIKIDQPQQYEGELMEDYVSRANAYFDETVDDLSDIGSDENYYTWKDIEIGVTGGDKGASFVWKVNRQIVDEEMITAFHLFPWVLAKSFGTTKNYVQTQFDLLMTEVDSIQNEAKKFIEWIISIEFALKGMTDVKPIGEFQRLRDPAVKNIAVAERFRIDNVITKIKAGIISPDDGARELNYDRAYDNKKIFESEKEKEKPKERVDESEQAVDKDNGDTPDKKKSI